MAKDFFVFRQIGDLFVKSGHTVVALNSPLKLDCAN